MYKTIKQSTKMAKEIRLITIDYLIAPLILISLVNWNGFLGCLDSNQNIIVNNCDY